LELKNPHNQKSLISAIRIIPKELNMGKVLA